MHLLDGESFLALPSLSLQPPNRPITHKGILSSSTWAPRLSLLSTLGDPDPTGSGHQVNRDAWGATGCVNALDWEDGGQCRLATGGDDTKISIWAPGIDSGTSDDGATSPRLSYGLTEVIDTGEFVRRSCRSVERSRP